MRVFDTPSPEGEGLVPDYVFTPIADQTIGQNQSLIIEFEVTASQVAGPSFTVNAGAQNYDLYPTDANLKLDLVSTTGNTKKYKLTLKPNGVGNSTITVWAHNQNARYASDTFEVIMPQGGVVPVVRFLQESQTVIEGSGSGTTPVSFGIGLFHPTTGAAMTSSQVTTGTVSLSHGSSHFAGTGVTTGTDFGTLPTSFTIAAGQSQGTISIPVTRDSALESDEAFTVQFSNVSANAVAGSPNAAHGRINNDDVNSLPTISDIGDQTTNEDVFKDVYFTVGDAETAASALTITATSNNPTLLPSSGIFIGGNYGVNRSVHLLPASNKSGTAQVTITVTDEHGGSRSDTFTLNVVAVNDPPKVNIQNQTLWEDTPLLNVPFTVSDVESPPESITLSVSVDDPTIFPPGSITFGGTGANRTISFFPAANKYGSVVATITASDGSASAQYIAIVSVNSVNDLPTVSLIDDQTTLEDVPINGISFTVADVDSPAGSLWVTASSDNHTLFAPSNITIGGSGSNRTLSLIPGNDATGTAEITITVADSSGSVTEKFTVTVTSVNDPPTISEIPDQTTSEEVPLNEIPFTVDDEETSPNSLTVSASASDETLFPLGSIALGGSGSSRTISLTPAPNQSGSAVITVIVSDGTSSTTETFDVTVSPVNDPPTISSVSGQQMLEDTTAGPISLTVTDYDSPSVAVSATSDNAVLFPFGSITVTGTGEQRSIYLEPAPNRYGTATITLTASDGHGGEDTTTFYVDVAPVNDEPTFTMQGLAPAIFANAGEQIVPNFADDMSEGPFEDQTLTFEVNVIDTTFTLTFASPPTIDPITGDLTYEAADGTWGTATVEVVLRDNGSGSSPHDNESAPQQFLIVVNQIDVGSEKLQDTIENATTPGTHGQFKVTAAQGAVLPDGLEVRLQLVTENPAATLTSDYALYYLDNGVEQAIGVTGGYATVQLNPGTAQTPASLVVYVKPVNDTKLEGTEKVKLVVSPQSPNDIYKAAVQSDPAVVLIEDDDKQASNSIQVCGGCPVSPVTANEQTGSSIVIVSEIGLAAVSDANPHPVIAFGALFNSQSLTAERIEAQLTFNGVVHGSVWYDPSTLPSNLTGDEFRIALQSDATGLGDGHYPWQVVLTEHFASGPDKVRTYNGSYEIINRIDSEFGNRWMALEVDRIYAQSGGVLLVTGSGVSHWYASDGNGGYVRPTGDRSYSTLTFDSAASDYVFLAKDGTESRFDATKGTLEGRTDRNGNFTQFLYTDADLDGVQDEIDTIIDPVGRIKFFGYVNGLLQTIVDDGRVTSITHADGKLESVTGVDPDGTGNLLAPVTEFGYDLNTGMLTWMKKYPSAGGPAEQTTIQYREDRTVQSISRPGGATETYTAEDSVSLVPFGQEASTYANPLPLVSAANARAASSDGVRAPVYTKHDQFGLPLSVEQNGQVTQYERDSEGRVTKMISPPVPEGPFGSLISYVTSYEYDSQGNLKKQIHPDSTIEEWDYDPVFNQLVKYTDQRGKVTLYDLYPNGDVHRMRRVVGLADDSLNGETNDVVTTFEYTPFSINAGVTDPPAGLLKAVVDPNGNRTEHEYDHHGNLRFEKYAVGTSDYAYVEYVYDYANRDRLTDFYDELRRQTHYEYYENDLVKETHLPDPYTTANRDDLRAAPKWLTEYDRFDRVTRSELLTTDPRAQGLFSGTQYSADGNVDKEIRPDHDGDGNLTITNFDYLPNGQLQYVVNPLGHEIEYHYDALGRQDWVKLPDPDGDDPDYVSPVTSTTYDAMGRVSTTTDERGNVTSYAYENFGRKVIVTSPPVIDSYLYMTPTSRYRTTSEYDAAGNVILERVTRHNATTLAQVQVISQTSYVYDDLGRLWKTIEASHTATPRTTVHRYDAVGNLVLTIDSAHASSTLAQSSAPITAAELTAANVGQANPTQNIYDHRNRLIEIRMPDADGNRADTSDMPVMTYVYADDGQVVSVTDPENRMTEYQYDGQGRLWKEISPDPDASGPALSSVTEYLYDDANRLWKVIDPRLQVTEHAYDTLGNRISVIEPDRDGVAPFVNPTTVYSYDSAGRLLSLTDPEDNITSWEYDDLGRVELETNQLSQTRSFFYDAASNLTRRVDRLGRAIDFTYDALGRLAVETWRDASNTALRNLYTDYHNGGLSVYQWDYKASGQPESYTSVLQQHFNTLGQLTLEHAQTAYVDANGLEMVFSNTSHTYDAVGNRNQTTYNYEADSFGYLRQNYSHDQLGRLTQILEGDSPGTGSKFAQKRADFSYYRDGKLKDTLLYADTVGTKHVATTHRDYDDMGRLSSLNHDRGATHLAGYVYTYDAASRIQSIDFGTHVTTYGHDNTNQLTSADNSSLPDEAYEYDENGNRVMTGYVPGDNNQTLEDPTYTYTYDAEGNRLTRTHKTSGEFTEYTWDHRNRLTRVTTKTAASGSLVKTVDLQYDPVNRLVRETVTHAASPTTPRKRFFVQDGNRIVLQLDGTSSVELTHNYLWGPGIDQLLADEKHASANAPGTVNWTFGDHLGTVRDIAQHNVATGVTNVVNHREYDSFGNLLSETNAAHDVVFGFTGRYFDEATGLQNNLNRWYDSGVGQWLSEDPIGFMGGDFSLRRYAHNATISRSDPSGLADVYGIYHDYPVSNKSHENRQAVIARLGAIKAKHDGFLYSRPSGLSTYLGRLDKLVTHTTALAIGEPPSPTQDHGGRYTSILMLNMLSYNDSIKTIAETTFLHELTHFYDDANNMHLTDNPFVYVGDAFGVLVYEAERTTYSLEHLLNSVWRFQNFENSVRSGKLRNPGEIEAAWQLAWTTLARFKDTDIHWTSAYGVVPRSEPLSNESFASAMGDMGIRFRHSRLVSVYQCLVDESIGPGKAKLTAPPVLPSSLR